MKNLISVSLTTCILINLFSFSGCGPECDLSLTAYYPTEIFPTSAIINGNLRADECYRIQSQGFCYGLNVDPTVDDMVVEGIGSGDFTAQLTGLSPGETYNVRPFAIDDKQKVYYGPNMGFAIDTTVVKYINDVQGNLYKVVDIGDQCWMAESLRVRAYNDGSSMPEGSYINFDMNNTYEVPYGLLYFSDVADIDRLCPVGWHVPTREDLKTLVMFLGDSLVAGGKMKETGTLYWDDPNVGATNESGFSGRAGGAYTGANGGGFFGFGDRVWFRGSPYFGYSLWVSNTEVTTTGSIESDAAYCRCIRDN